MTKMHCDQVKHDWEALRSSETRWGGGGGGGLEGGVPEMPLGASFFLSFLAYSAVYVF